MRRVVRAALAAGVLAATATAARAEWVAQTNPEFGFSAIFPATPQMESSTEDGFKLNTWGAGDGQAMCLVATGLYPNDFEANDELKASRDNFADGVAAKVTSSSSTTFARGATKLPAMQFDANSTDIAYRSIIVVDGRRVYQVAGAVAQSGGDRSLLDRCVTGFKLTAK